MEKSELVKASEVSVSSGSINDLLNEIRPVWRAKGLIVRVERLLVTDPSSACQRLFNAAIWDLKNKIIVLGVDLAREVASTYKLPAVTREDEVTDYNVSKTIDLAYRMGILSRSERNRMHISYEIRRNLEHEDNEYEATVEDCFYIFKTTIETVLSQDPQLLLKVTDVKQLIEMPRRPVLSEEFIVGYKNAPALRQKEINQLLISYAFDGTKPDVVRENSIEVMRSIRHLTQNATTIELAAILEDKLGSKPIDLITAKVGHACGATAYFKKVKLKDFYLQISKDLAGASGWETQGRICLGLEDIGGIYHCPKEALSGLLKLLVSIYIGEPGYGRYRSTRPVFYSDKAIPVIERMIVAGNASIIKPHLEALAEDKDIASSIENKHISRRYEDLLDLVSAS